MKGSIESPMSDNNENIVRQSNQDVDQLKNLDSNNSRDVQKALEITGKLVGRINTLQSQASKDPETIVVMTQMLSVMNRIFALSGDA